MQCGGYENPGRGNKEPDHREYLILRQYLLSEDIYLSIYTCIYLYAWPVLLVNKSDYLCIYLFMKYCIKGIILYIYNSIVHL